MKIPNLPKDVSYIVKQLTEAGFEAYIVGGCVRDCILGRVPQDWDITTSAKPEQVKDIFSHTFDTGIQHGTITVVLHHTNYEVTTYRIDGIYLDGRHPKEVFFTDKITEDLRRRDFTMNAIAYHPDIGYQDPFHGMEDIANQIIRGVGNPSERFQEDALRMLRALRFSAQLGFTIEKETYEALTENKELIQKISVERIYEELEKLILAEHIHQLALLWESGLLQEISPLLNESLKDKKEGVIPILKKAPKDIWIRWAILLQERETKEAERFFKKMKADVKTTRIVMQLLECIHRPFPETSYAIRKEAGNIGIERMQQWICLEALLQEEKKAEEAKRLLEEILHRNDCLQLKQLEVTGNDLMELGVEKGKKVGELLNALLDEVQQFPEKNQKHLLLEMAKEKI